jgi:hypothetical protein
VAAARLNQNILRPAFFSVLRVFVLSSVKELELKAWRLSAFIMVALAALVFVVQRFFGPVFDSVFEICIFYIPAFTAVILFLYLRKRLK